MPVSETQIKKIVNYMLNMKPEEVFWFKDWPIEEAKYIHHLIANQKGRMFECNGTIEKPETITKFRKMPNLIPDDQPKYIFNSDPNRKPMEALFRSKSKAHSKAKKTKTVTTINR